MNLNQFKYFLRSEIDSIPESFLETMSDKKIWYLLLSGNALSWTDLSSCSSTFLNHLEKRKLLHVLCENSNIIIVPNSLQPYYIQEQSESTFLPTNSLTLYREKNTIKISSPFSNGFMLLKDASAIEQVAFLFEGEKIPFQKVTKNLFLTFLAAFKFLKSNEVNVEHFIAPIDYNFLFKRDRYELPTCRTSLLDMDELSFYPLENFFQHHTTQPFPKEQETQLKQTLAQRTTKRNHDNRNPVSLGELCTLLSSSLDRRETKNHSGKIVHYFLYPSGGAICEIQCFILVNQVKGIKKGFYFFDILNRRIANIEIDEKTYGQLIQNVVDGWLASSGTPQCVCYLTSNYLLRRTKYSDIALKNALISVGAAMQNLYLNAQELGLKICPIGSTDSDSFYKASKLNPIFDVPLLEVSIGR